MDGYIVIAFYKGVSWLSKLIMFFTDGKYSHVSAPVVNEYWNIEANYDIWHYGVVETPNLFVGHSEGTIIDLYKIPCSREEHEKFYGYLREQIGKKYDWLGILGLRLPMFKNRQDKFFCSELIFTAFEKAGIKVLQNIEANKVTPKLLSISPKLSFVGQRRG